MKLARRNIQRLLLGIISLALAACNAPSQSAHLTTIAFVNNLATFDSMIDAFKTSMNDAGFVEGKSVTYLYDGAVNNVPAEVDKAIEKISSQNPDVYVSIGSLAATRLKAVAEKTNKPVVFMTVTNPKALGLVQEDVKPGGKLTGVTVGGPLITKSLEWMITVAPDIKRVHVYYLQGELTAPSLIPLLQPVADKLKVELVVHEVKSVEEVMADLANLTRGTDAVLRIPVLNLNSTQTATYYLEAISRGIPMGSTQAGGVASGNLTGINIDITKVAAQGAQLTQQIIRGADPATLPVQPVQFTLEVNLAVANGLGLTIPDSVLQQANKVVQTITTPIPPTPAAQQGTAEATATR